MKDIPFGVPMLWLESNNHVGDCHYSENMGSINDEHGESFHQVIAELRSSIKVMGNPSRLQANIGTSKGVAHLLITEGKPIVKKNIRFSMKNIV